MNEFDQRFPDAPNFGHTVARRPSRSHCAALDAQRRRWSTSSASASRAASGSSSVSRTSGGPQTFADTNGYAIDLDANIGLTNWHTRNTLSGRSAYQYTFDETLNWQKGKHSVTFGGGAFLGRAWDDSQQQVPGINLGFDTTNDPAAGMFSTANFPGASAAQLTDARELYALLTGRVAAVTGQAALDAETNKYSFLGKRRRAGKLDNYSAFVQDSWRLTPTVTLNAGLRWDVQTPFAPVNDTMSAVTLASMSAASPGSATAASTTPATSSRRARAAARFREFAQFTSGTNGYNTDWNNVAPNVGVAWRPNVQSGFLRTLLGDPEQATLRGGYSVAYERQGFGVFTGVYRRQSRAARSA